MCVFRNLRGLFLFVFMLGPALAWAQGYSPKEAARRMLLPDGFTIKMVASEPQVRQPILVKHDDRITILEDTDGDGRADKFKDFVDGLNLATGLAFGHGGVFVIQVPYLLFYPDRDRDDVPDGDPVVCLKGFGMEDSQSFANHLTWGPDGWLYGLNGSTTTCNIRGIEFQQGVWRYHPVSKEFELFCEGGGNIYGMTFDAQGQLFYSSNGTRPSWPVASPAPWCGANLPPAPSVCRAKRLCPSPGNSCSATRTVRTLTFRCCCGGRSSPRPIRTAKWCCSVSPPPRPGRRRLSAM